MAKQTNSIAPDAGGIGTSTKAISQLEKQLRQTIKVLQATSKATGGVDGSIAKLNIELKREAQALGMSNAQVQKLAKSMGVLEVRNNRNGMALSVFRSKLLMFNFTIGLAAKFTTDLVKAFGEQERAEKQVTASLISTNHASGQTTESIIAYANAMQKATGMGDEMILGSAALLNTFTNISGDVFPQAQTAILDVAAAMYQGNVTMEALKTTTTQVGKALNDPVKGMSALGRVGIQFTATQKIMIKRFSNLGQISKAQAIILKELNVQFKGSATNGDDANKSFRAFSAAVSDFQQRIGGSIAPAFEKLIDLTTKFINALSMERILKFIGAMGFLATSFKVYRNWVVVSEAASLLWSRTLLVLTGRVSALTVASRYLSATGIGVLLTGLALLAAWATSSSVKIGEATKAINELDIASENAGNRQIKYGNALADATAKRRLYDRVLEEGGRTVEAGNLLNKDYARALRAVGEETKVSAGATTQASKDWRIAQVARINGLDIEHKKIVLVNQEKRKNDALNAGKIVEGAGTTKLKEKYTGLAQKQEDLNKHVKDYGLVMVDATLNEKLMAKAASTLGITLSELKTGKEGSGLPDLVEDIKNYTDAVAIAAERTQRMAEAAKLKQAAISFMTGMYDQEIQKQNAVMDNDIANMKKTSAYKAASKRGDTKKMEALEKAARAKSLPARVKAFKNKQNVALAGIAIDTAGAIMKAYKDYGWPAALPVQALIGIAGALQAGTVLQEKPPAYAKGGDFVTSGPQMIQVGDNPGGRERVSVTPLSSPNFEGPQGGSVNISFSGNVMSQDFIEDEAIPMIKEAIRRGADIGVA